MCFRRTAASRANVRQERSSRSAGSPIGDRAPSVSGAPTAAPVDSAAVKVFGRFVIACGVTLGVLATGGGALVADPVGEPQGFVSGIVKDPAGVPVPSIWIACEG